MENTLLETIKNFRKSKKLTQADMANRIGMAKESYRDIEAGKIAMKMDIFFKICEVLEIKPEYLVKKGDEVILVINQEQAKLINDLSQQLTALKMIK